MTYEVAFIVKGVPADLTAMRRSQTGFPTSAADNRLVIGLMAADVSLQLSALGETFTADFATEWHLTIVGFHVALQRACVAELFLADGARERFFCRVDPQVRYHVPLLVEAFSTDVAAEGFLSCVQPQVRLLRSD